MTVRRLSVLSWVGLVLGGIAWGTQHVIGYFVTEARCGASRAVGANDAWQAVGLGLGVAFILVAEAAAIGVILQTREVSYDDTGPPLGRIRFLAIAAAAANAIFLVIVILSGTGSIVDTACTSG